MCEAERFVYITASLSGRTAQKREKEEDAS